MSEEDDIRLAEGYCTEALDQSARAEVELRAQTDADFRQLLDDTKKLLQGIEGAGRKELMRTMDQWEQEFPVESEVKVIPWKTWTVVGIAASMLLAVAFYFFSRSEPVLPSLALFNEYYQPYPNVVMPTVRGTGGESSEMAQAYRLYDLEDYQKAVEVFSGLAEKDAASYFYLGQCYLLLGETDLAITNFKSSLALEESFTTQAQWYLALAYMKQGDVVAAKEQLKKVAISENSYSPKADSILSRF